MKAQMQIFVQRTRTSEVSSKVPSTVFHGLLSKRSSNVGPNFKISEIPKARQVVRRILFLLQIGSFYVFYLNKYRLI